SCRYGHLDKVGCLSNSCSRMLVGREASVGSCCRSHLQIRRHHVHECRARIQVESLSLQALIGASSNDIGEGRWVQPKNQLMGTDVVPTFEKPLSDPLVFPPERNARYQSFPRSGPESAVAFFLTWTVTTAPRLGVCTSPPFSR